jgi:RHS repeat-associated protein
MRQRARWMVVAAICCAAGLSIWLAWPAEGQGSSDEAPASTTAGAKLASYTGTLGSLAVPDVQQLDEGQQAVDEAYAHHSSSAAYTARRRSRTEFEHLGKAAAAKVARESFPKVVDHPASELPQLPAGERVASYIDPNAARVDLPEGKHAVLESMGAIARQTAPGHYAPIDLALASSNGSYAPVAPDVAVRIPTRLDDGIQLPEAGVSLTPVNEQGTPLGGSTGVKDGSTVLYANTETDTDTIAKPIAAGVEVDGLLRSVASPSTLRFRVGMPTGASLVHAAGTDEVRVVEGGRTIAEILTPYAHDAAGMSVPLSSEIAGHVLSVAVETGSGEYQYPIAVDPSVKDKRVTNAGTPTNWRFESNPSTGSVFTSSGWSEGSSLLLSAWGRYNENEAGMIVYPLREGSTASIEDLRVGVTTNLTGTNAAAALQLESPSKSVENEIAFSTNFNQTVFVADGVCRNKSGTCPSSERGSFGNAGRFAIRALPGSGEGASTLVENASVTINQEKGAAAFFDLTNAYVDGGRPNVLYGSGAWLGPNSGAFEVHAKDEGLGISYLSATAGIWSEAIPILEQAECVGVQCNPEFNKGFVYNSKMADGEDSFKSSACDAAETIGHCANSAEWTIKVDGTKPYGIKLTGLPAGNEFSDDVKYTLKAEAVDGTKPTISSGIKSMALLLDGRELGTANGTCSPGECTAKAEWTFGVEAFGAGQHTLTVLATDNAGNVTTESFVVTVRHATPVALGPGSVTPGTGEFSLAASDVSIGAPPAGLAVNRDYNSWHTGTIGPLGPQWNLSLGSQESLYVASTGNVELISGNGQSASFVNKNSKGEFESPKSDANVVLEGKEHEAGKGITEYLLKNPAQGVTTKFEQLGGSGLQATSPSYAGAIGSGGAGTGQFDSPIGVATDLQGDVWVLDSGHSRLEEFDERGEYEKSVGNLGIGNGQLKYPKGIATDSKGNIWVADADNNRIMEFNETGKFVAGIGYGVKDGKKEFEVCQSSCEGGISGGGTGQFQYPEAVATDSHGNLFVSDTGNHRVEEFNEKREYIATIGLKGSQSLEGEELQGLAIDPHGDIWVEDWQHNRIEEFDEKGNFIKVIGYGVSDGLEKFETCTSNCRAGIRGSGNGQFAKPYALSIDASGNLWVGDTENQRVEIFNEKGEYLNKFGSEGAGAGQFRFGGVAGLTRRGNYVWITDTSNNRLQKWAMPEPSTRWLPTVADGPAATDTVTYVYKTMVLGAQQIVVPTEELGPKPAGVTKCPEEPAGAERGCRELTFKYAEATTATGEGESEWKEYAGRLAKVSFTAYNPTAKAMETKVVAEYAYDKQGRLRAEWNPQISPALKTIYGYDGEGHVTALTQPGQESWAFTYGTIAGESSTGRIIKVAQAPTSAKLWKGEAPKVTEAPKLSGGSVVGATMSVSNGTWANEPVAYGYRWEDCNGSGKECAPILGATNPSYKLATTDSGHMIVAVVTATNGGGSISSTTTASSPVLGAEVVEYPLPAGSHPFAATAGPDGNVWFTESLSDKLGKITTAGVINEYPTEKFEPEGIAAGPDGNLWFVEHTVRNVGHMTTSGALTEFTLPRTSTYNVGIAAGPDENLWFTESETNYIGKINKKDEVLGEYPLPASSKPYGITVGPDKNLWFTDYGTGKVGKITTAGVVTEYALPAGSQPYAICSGPDGNLWFTDYGTGKVGKITTAGVVTEYGLPTSSAPHGIVTGPDGNLWVAEYGTNKIARITTGGAITEYSLPSGSNPSGITVGSDKNIWFTEYGTNKIGKIGLHPAEGESRPSQPGWTVEYRVPLSGGATGLPTMTAGEVEKWGQTDDPAEATAIFPPDEPQGWPASGYKRANVYYEDNGERQVNVASPSGGISTAEYNATNDVVRTLSSDNRAAALKEGSKSAEVSKALDTETEYNPEGNEVLKTLGPLHTIRLSGGSEVQGRAVAHDYYDEGAPASGETYRLVTKRVNAALVAGKEEEPRTVAMGYGGQENRGWELRKPTSITTDPGGLNLVRSTLYEGSTGEVSETKSPGGSGSGGGSGSWVYASQFGNGDFAHAIGDAVDGHGNVWVANGFGNNIEEFSSSGTHVGTYAEWGSGSGQVKEPIGIAVNQSTGNVYVGDDQNNRVEEFNEKGGFVKTFGWGVSNGEAKLQVCTSTCKAGTSGGGAGQLNETGWIAVDASGNIWVGDESNNRVQEFKENGEFVRTFGWGVSNGEAKFQVCTSACHAGIAGSGSGQFSNPTGIAVSGGHVYVGDLFNNRIEEFSTEGAFIAQFGTSGSGEGQFAHPGGLAVDGAGNVYVADIHNSRVEEFSATGAFVAQFGKAGAGNNEFEEPEGLATDSAGNVYVMDSENNRVVKWSKGSGNTAAHNTKTTYYTAGGEAEVATCRNHPEWVGLPCQAGPVAQPGTAGLPELPVASSTYNFWDEPEVSTETVGATTRTRTATYDPAGRLATLGTASTVGTALPVVTYKYNVTSGALEKQSATFEGKAESITSEYNSRGQLGSYKDADENVSTNEYDEDGRIKKSNDGRGLETYRYGETTGLPEELVNEYGTSKLTFTAAYDLEGNMVSEGDPNGMTANFAYNAVGKQVGVEYVKTNHCSEKCPETWFKDADTQSIQGQTASQVSSFGSDSYMYDNAGRLKQVQETPPGKACQARIYGYDEETDRTSETRRECSSEGGEVENHTYDSADRLTDTGVEYSQFGNITKLPAADAGGNPLTSTFYVNNQLATQEQNGETIGYYLDPAGRTRQLVSSGKTAANVVQHYMGPGDTPAWTTNTSGEATRNIWGLGGELAATQNNAEIPVLQIANLHGDVVATASASETATKPLSTSNTTEFGVPTTSLPSKYSWLGAIGLPTELPSGVVAMGVRSYVPQLGRFLQPDPRPMGSANAYAYTFGDPIDQSDPSGEWTFETPAFLRESDSEWGAREAAVEAARLAAERAEAERLAREAEEASGFYAGTEEWGWEEWEWEEWEEEEYEYAAYHHGEAAENSELHSESAVLYQPLGETQEGGSEEAEHESYKDTSSRGGPLAPVFPHPNGHRVFRSRRPECPRYNPPTRSNPSARPLPHWGPATEAWIKVASGEV